MKALFAIALAVALTTAPVAYSQTVDTQADILKAATEWMDAYNKKDATTVAKLYSTDAVLSSPRDADGRRPGGDREWSEEGHGRWRLQ